MVLKVHGVPQSTCTRRLLVVLEEKKVPYEVVIVKVMEGEHKKPPHLAKQPFGKIPYLEDDGFFLYESRAIAKYIAKKYESQGTKLIPADGDLKGYGLFEQACSLEQNYFNGPAEGLAYEKVFKSMKKLGEPDEAIVAKHTASLEDTLKVYDSILSKQAYLAGDELTVADLYHLPYAVMNKQIGFAELYNKFPHVTKWLDGLVNRESWIKVNEGSNKK